MQYTTPPPQRNPRIIRIAIRAYARGWLPLGVVAWLCRRGGQR